MERFFTMSSNNSQKTPFAQKILSSSAVNLSNCPICGRTRFNHANKDLTLIIEGKGKLPDYLLCGHFPLIIISHRVIEAWGKYQIGGYESFPIRTVNAQGVEICREIQYQNVIITGRAELDYKKMDVKIVKECSMCGGVEYNKDTWEFGTTIMKEGSYDNSDLFAFKHFEMAPLCNLKVVKIIYEMKFTNFGFRNIDNKFNFFAPKIDAKDIIGIQ